MTTTQTISRERLEEIRDYDTCVTLAESAEMARMLLAGMSSEPVYFVEIEGDQDINAGRIEGKDRPDLGLLPDGINYLYVAPPAPAISDETIDRIVAPLSAEGLDEEKHHCEWHLYHDRERIRKALREYFSAPPAPVMHAESSLIEHCKKCAVEVAQWPEWKKRGANALAAITPPAPVAVPDEMTPEMMREVQLRSELGAYAAANMSGAYDLFAEFWRVACRAAMQAEPATAATVLNDDVHNALTLALNAMEFMGDTLNSLDAVCTEDVEQVTPAFEAVRKLLAADPEQPVTAANTLPGWIKCRDGYPNIREEVLIRIPVCGYYNVENAKYKGDGVFAGAWCDSRGLGCAYKVSHWMPLPESPEQEV